jgi:DNA modification methylase
MKKTIQIKCKGADLIPFESIEIFQGDLKKLSKPNLEKLKALILKLGFCAPFFIWQNEGHNWCLDGTQRDRALKALQADGYEIPLLPVAYIDAENEQDAREKLLSISSQFGQWDLSELDEWIQNIDEEIKESFRFLDKEIKMSTKNETIADDDYEELEIKGIVKEGDLIELNKHKLICGEFPNDNYKNINIDWILTDPPYGINVVNRTIGGGKKNTIGNLDKRKVGYDSIIKANKYIPIKNDDKPYDPTELLKMSNNRIIFGGNYFANKLPISSGWMVWDKNEGREWKDTFADAELIYTSSKIHSKIYRILWKGMVKRESGKRKHPAQKPIKLICELINDFTKENNIICDPFLGSGSTIIACEKTNRICYGIEIEPYYCEQTIFRFQNWCKKNNREYNIKINNKIYND